MKRLLFMVGIIFMGGLFFLEANATHEENATQKHCDSGTYEGHQCTITTDCEGGGVNGVCVAVDWNQISPESGSASSGYFHTGTTDLICGDGICDTTQTCVSNACSATGMYCTLASDCHYCKGVYTGRGCSVDADCYSRGKVSLVNDELQFCDGQNRRRNIKTARQIAVALSAAAGQTVTGDGSCTGTPTNVTWDTTNSKVSGECFTITATEVQLNCKGDYLIQVNCSAGINFGGNQYDGLEGYTKWDDATTITTTIGGHGYLASGKSKGSGEIRSYVNTSLVTIVSTTDQSLNLELKSYCDNIKAGTDTLNVQGNLCSMTVQRM